MAKIDLIKKLSKEILSELKETKTMEIYTLINSSKETKNISYGTLSGLSDELWPTNYNREKTEFHFILNLNDFPVLKKKFPEFEALAYFVERESSETLTASVTKVNNYENDYNEDQYDCDCDYNDYDYDPYNVQYNKVVLLTKENYKKCSVEGKFKEVIKFTVPSIVFGNPSDNDLDLTNLSIPLSRELGEKLKELNKAIYQLSVRVGGNPIWLQDNPGISNFIMQFNEGFADINMGDSGIMYLNNNDGFWQSY